MSCLYGYCGPEALFDAVATRLSDADFEPVEDLKQAEIIVTYCLSQSVLEERYFGEGGLIGLAEPGVIFIDLSAGTPHFAREMSAVATVSDQIMIEAPIVLHSIGTEDPFNRDNLTVYVAAEMELPPLVDKFLDALAADVRELGGPGAAQLARAAHTLREAAGVVALTEADALIRAHKRHIAASDLRLTGKFDDGLQMTALARAIRDDRFDNPFTVEMLMAELAAALMAADDVDLIMPQAEAALHLLELLAVIGGADKSPSALSLVFRDEKDGEAAGLNWKRAEQAYGGAYIVDEDDEDECGCGCGHDHDHEDDFFDDDDFNGFNFMSN